MEHGEIGGQPEEHDETRPVHGGAVVDQHTDPGTGTRIVTLRSGIVLEYDPDSHS
ncbi:hypothetical protein [Leifsonia sp. SIMBA_070]|uniref:hypothetical protein n=1 Tax=Leifsonia sp. SIMBA_070 TaxID=3085810 RepID=UPI00397846EE